MPREAMSGTRISEMVEKLSLAAIMRVIPYEKVKEALEATGTVSKRIRLVPAQMVVYLVMLLAFFAEVSVRENPALRGTGATTRIIRKRCSQATTPLTW